MRHILAASAIERNALVRAFASNRSHGFGNRNQQWSLLILEPARDQRPDLSLRRFAHQHLDVTEITAESLLASQADKLFPVSYTHLTLPTKA